MAAPQPAGPGPADRSGNPGSAGNPDTAGNPDCAARPVPRDFVRLGEGYHSPQLDVEVRLNTNESPEPPPAAFTAALRDALAGIDWHRYPDRQATRLRAAIAEHHGVSAEQVFVANGSNEALQTLLLAYGGAGRTVAVFEPTYALHGHLARLSGADVAEGTRAEDFSLDLDEAKRLIAETAPSVTFLCSPNNPTGVVDSPADIAAVLDLAAQAGGLLCVDEAYGQFCAFSACSLLGPDVPLVVSRTYSKTWALAGLRLGYLLAPPWVVAELHKTVLPYHLDAFKQIAGVLALDHEAAMAERVARLVAERERLVGALGGLDVDVSPSGANFVLFAPRSRDGEAVWQGLVERSVLVRNCAAWPRLHGRLRVTVGTPDENDRFLAALREVLA